MTTELSRCFSSMGSSASKKAKGAKQPGCYEDPSKAGECNSNSGSSSRMAAGGHGQSSSPPPSPLRQFQQRIVASLANPAPRKQAGRDEHGKKVLKASCDSKCGTYRATLVDALPDDDDEDEDEKKQQNGQPKPIDIVENPSCGRANNLPKMNTSIITNTEDYQDSDDCHGQQNNKLSSLVEPRKTKTTPPQHQQQQQQQQRQQDDETLYESEVPTTLFGCQQLDTKTSNNNNNIKCNNQTSPTDKQQMIGNVKFKRVVLYSDCEPNQEDKQIVASSAEIYNMVSELGDTRARLRKVGSLKSHRHKMDNNDQTTYHHDEEEDRQLERMQADNEEEACYDELRDKRNVYVRSLVQSIESNNSFELITPTKRSNPMDHNNNNASETNYNSLAGFTKPVTFVKPMPPKTPPKTIKAKCLNIQLSLNKPTKIQQLFQDEKFLTRFFNNLDPIDRCVAAQVCRLWRNILYANQNYWEDLVMVVDCTQMRREHLVDCILSTLQIAKLKHYNKTITGSDSSHRLARGVRSSSGARSYDQPGLEWSQQNYCPTNSTASRSQFDNQFIDSGSIHEKHDCKQYNSFTYDFDLEDVWRIQELCNRFTAQRTGTNSVSRQQSQQTDNNVVSVSQHQNQPIEQQQQQQQQQQICTASKSSSIPSQISSTLSSVSLSSLLSPLSESSRIESLKEKLYVSFDNRGFDALCLFGATNEDIEDLISKTPIETHRRIVVGRLNNCSITNTGLESFIGTFNRLEELELSGCNEITNSTEFKSLSKLKRLIITDCINIADGLAQKLIQILDQLDELTIQAYHLTDAFLEYLGLNSDTSKLIRLELPNCKEITNQSLITIAKHFSQLEALSLSGSSKISDDGIEILAEQARQLKILDLSWCSRITDASLECIACDLGETLTDLILDRNIHVTDIGLGYLTTMKRLKLLHIRWCPRVTDVGLESVIAINSLRYLSLAGIHQITARSLLCLIEAQLLEVELTNCPAVNNELALFLSSKMPKCNIIF